jgi:phosphoglycolate phosphatase-like HAD superfamily hydrolase
MAIRVPIVSDFDDKGIKGATAGFAKLKADVAAANGAMGKFKAAGSGAFAAVQANALTFAAAAGAAVFTFAAKAVTAFRDLGLAVGKFSDATGVTVEEASRLIEVTGDLNIESNTLLASLNKMNRAVASGSDAFKDIGAEIARTSSGAVDVNKTFLNVIDALNRIENPAARAKAATELLGRGWTELSRMVGMGADELIKALENVSDVKVFDDQAVRDAEELDAAFKNLGDVWEDVSLIVGKELVPALADALEGVLGLLQGIRDVSNYEIFGVKVGTLVKVASTLGSAAITGARAVTALGGASEQAAGDVEGFASAEEAAAAQMEAANEALEAQAQALAIASAAVDNYRSKLEFENEFMSLIESTEEFAEYSDKAWLEGTQNSFEYLTALNDNKLALIDFAEELLITASVADRNAILIKVDTGQIRTAIGLMNELLRKAGIQFATENGTLYGTVGGYGGVAAMLPPGLDFSGFMADGGVVSGPTLAVIGEAGPEAVIPLDRLGTMGGVTVNVYGSVTTETDLIESIRQGLVNAQRNGSQLIYSN